MWSEKLACQFFCGFYAESKEAIRKWCTIKAKWLLAVQPQIAGSVAELKFVSHQDINHRCVPLLLLPVFNARLQSISLQLIKLAQL